MNEQEAKVILEQLAKRDITESRISKEQFMEFRKQLIKREDFKHFHGNAQHGGEVIYTYVDEARS